MGLRAAMVCESLRRGDGAAPQLLGLERVPFDWSQRTAADERWLQMLMARRHHAPDPSSTR
jgi:hypothetical protein